MKNTSNVTSTHTYSIVLTGSLLFVIAAFYNRFPLLVESSYLYFQPGFNYRPFDGHTLLYGFFLLYSSYGFSIWLVVGMQALLLSISTYYAFKYFSVSNNKNRYYLSFILLISFFSAASLVASTIESYIFRSICIICTGLLLCNERLSKQDFLIIALTLSLSLGMDVCNLVYAFSIVSIYLLYYFGAYFFHTKKVKILRGISSICVIVSITIIFLSIISYIFKNDWNFLEKSIKINAGHNPFIFLSNYHQFKKFFLIPNYPQLKEGSKTLPSLSYWFSWELRECLLGKQYRIVPQFSMLNITQNLTVIICLGVFICKYRSIKEDKVRSVFIFILTSIGLLAIITSILSNASPNIWQYSWLIALPLFLVEKMRFLPAFFSKNDTNPK